MDSENPQNKPMNSDLNQQTQNTIQNYLGALAQRDLNALLSFFPENVDWYIPGDEKLAPWLGRKNNKKEIRDFFQLLWENTEPLSAQIDHLFIDGNQAAVIGAFSSRMTKTGKKYDSLFFIHFTLEDNLIVRYRLQEDSLALVEALN